MCLCLVKHGDSILQVNDDVYNGFRYGEWHCRRLWDALSGEELHSFEHKHIVRTIQFSQVKKPKKEETEFHFISMLIGTYELAYTPIRQVKQFSINQHP